MIALPLTSEEYLILMIIAVETLFVCWLWLAKKELEEENKALINIIDRYRNKLSKQLNS